MISKTVALRVSFTRKGQAGRTPRQITRTEEVVLALSDFAMSPPSAATWTQTVPTEPHFVLRFPEGLRRARYFSSAARYRGGTMWKW
eukprot:1906618-Rhodomonas_salina.1